MTLGTTYREPGPLGVRHGTVTEFERPTKITFHQPMAMALHSGTVDVTVRYTLAPTAQSNRRAAGRNARDPLAAEAPPAAAGAHLAGRAAAHLARAQGLLRDAVLAQGRVVMGGSPEPRDHRERPTLQCLRRSPVHRARFRSRSDVPYPVVMALSMLSMLSMLSSCPGARARAWLH